MLLRRGLGGATAPSVREGGGGGRGTRYHAGLQYSCSVIKSRIPFINCNVIIQIVLVTMVICLSCNYPQYM